MNETINTKTTVLHRSADRGHANHGWLNAKHSFSFGGWYDPEKVHFGALRVLNDDTIAPGMGFGKHPHDNMEIITIPLSGAVKHEDSMGNSGTITTGEVQVMSAGTGIMHSEFNASKSEELKLFQIWIFPNKRGVQPRYDQAKFDLGQMKNQFTSVVGPNGDDAPMWIHQDAYIQMAEIESGETISYSTKGKNTGVYTMVVEGEIETQNETLSSRDAIGTSNIEQIEYTAKTISKLLVLEVPLNS